MEIAIPIDTHLKRRGAFQHEMFLTGLSLGILGSTILAIDATSRTRWENGHYFNPLNRFLQGIPIPLQPDKEMVRTLYKEVDLEEETSWSKEMVKTDPTLVDSLRLGSLPATVIIFLAGLNEEVITKVESIIPMYREVITTINKTNAAKKLDFEDVNLRREDRDWLDGVMAGFDLNK